MFIKSKKSLLFLMSLLVLAPIGTSSCSSGFGIYEFESDSTYIEITSSDSITHFYKEVLRFDRDMWCFKHAQWEVIEVR